MLHPDHVVAPRHGHRLNDALAQLPPGVTEVVLHPALDSSELRAYNPDWTTQVEDHLLLVDDSEVSGRLGAVRTIGYAGAARRPAPRLRRRLRRRRRSTAAPGWPAVDRRADGVGPGQPSASGGSSEPVAERWAGSAHSRNSS